MHGQNGQNPPAFFSEAEHQPFVLGGGPLGALLIHGFPGTPAEMRPLAEYLAGQGFTAYGPLLPGFGAEIARLGQTNRHVWLSAVRAAWADVQRRHETAVLIGFSLGGALALHLSRELPPAALALLAPFWTLGGWQFKLLPLLKRVMPSVAPFEKANFDDPAVRRELAQLAPGANLDDPEVQRFFRTEIRLPTAVIDEVRGLGLTAYRLALQVRVPTLVMQGVADEVVTPARTRRLVARLAGPVTYREFSGDHNFAKANSGTSHAFFAEIATFLHSVAAEGDPKQYA